MTEFNNQKLADFYRRCGNKFNELILKINDPNFRNIFVGKITDLLSESSNYKKNAIADLTVSYSISSELVAKTQALYQYLWAIKNNPSLVIKRFNIDEEPYLAENLLQHTKSEIASLLSESAQELTRHRENVRERRRNIPAESRAVIDSFLQERINFMSGICLILNDSEFTFEMTDKILQAVKTSEEGGNLSIPNFPATQNMLADDVKIEANIKLNELDSLTHNTIEKMASLSLPQEVSIELMQQYLQDKAIKIMSEYSEFRHNIINIHSVAQPAAEVAI